MKPERDRLNEILSRLGRPFGVARLIEEIPIVDTTEGWLTKYCEGVWATLVTDPRVRAPIFRMTMLKGSVIESHWHRVQEDLFVLTGRLLMVDGNEMAPDEHRSFAPSETHSIAAIEESCMLAVFQPGIRLVVSDEPEREKGDS